MGPRPGAFLLLLLTSCVAEPSGPEVSTLQSSPLSAVSTIRPVEGECREYSVPIVVGGKQEMAYGRACQQADGTWRIAEGPTGPDGSSVPPSLAQPTIIYPAYPYYYYDPWGPPWWGPPFGFVGAFAFDHHHHHHHHHHGHRDRQ
jgi:hypothetical protein